MTLDKDQGGSGPRQPRGPSWKLPDLYGGAEALNSMGTIAAPLLAGFSLAAVVQVLTVSESETRWPDVAFLLFVLAAVFFVGCVQAMFWARAYQVTPKEIIDWWPDATPDPERMDKLREEQAWHSAGFALWSNRGRIAYSAGLLFLLGALTTLAVPPDHHTGAAVRWTAVAVGAAALSAEALWTAASFAQPSRRPPWVTRLLEPPAE